jgi:zinc protease
LARRIIRDLTADRVTQSPQQEKALLAPMLASVSLDEINRRFKQNWADDHRLVLVSGDVDLQKSLSTPPEVAIRDAFLASAATRVHRPNVEDGAAFPYLPSPERSGEIAFQEIVQDLEITRIRLANGIWLNLKRTDFKTNEVLANLIFGHGKSAEPASLPGLSLITEATVNESGLGRMDTDQLKRALAGNSTYVDFRIAETHFTLFGESVSTEIELLFQLIHAYLLDPGFREAALTLSRERLRQEFASSSRSIDGMMRIEGLRRLADGDSRFGMPPFEKIKAIRLDDIRNWVAPQLQQAPLELSVVGDFDQKQLIALAQRYLGTLPERGPPTDNPRTDIPGFPAGTVTQIEVDTQIPKAMVVAAWQTDDFWEISRTRRLSVLADLFSERLRQRIREKLGAAYSPFAFNRASRAYPGYGVLQTYVSVAPDQTETVLGEVKAIAADLSEKGVGAEEVPQVVDPILTSIKEMRQTNGYWLNSVMTGSQRHPQQFEWARSFQKDYGAISAEELNTLAATYLVEQRAATIIVRPKPPAAD